MSGARLLETRLEYRRLSGELKAWFEARKDEDNLQQYFTQLRVLKEALVNLLERLEAKLDAAARYTALRCRNAITRRNPS